MKSVIYYFTGTGNSLAIAGELARGLGGNTELIPIVRAVRDDLIRTDADAVGIIYPIWLHHMPPVVEKFARRLAAGNAYLFAVASYFKNPGNSIRNLDAILGEGGKRLDSGFLFEMPGKYVLMFDLTASDEENHRRIIEAKRRIGEVVDAVRARRAVGLEGEPAEDDSARIIAHHHDVYRVIDKFRVNDDCDLCGVCVDVCPNGATAVVDGRIIWNERCEYCLACLHWCPKQAIENGDISPTIRRYHHPEVTVEDMKGQKEGFQSEVGDGRTA